MTTETQPTRDGWLAICHRWGTREAGFATEALAKQWTIEHVCEHPQ